MELTIYIKKSYLFMDAITLIVKLVKFSGVLLIESFGYDRAFDQFKVGVKIFLQCAVVLSVGFEF